MGKKELPTIKEKHTSKKVKFVGTHKFIDSSTGELVPMAVTEITERDFNFSKVWMQHFLLSMNEIGNKKLSVAFWVIDHLDRENRLICTHRKMADETGCSLATVTQTMKILQGSDFLRKIQSGVYMVNPEIIFKGGHNARMAICMDYRSIDYEKPELTKEEKAEQLRSIIKDTQAIIKDTQEELARLEGMEDAVEVEVEPQLNFNETGEIYQKAVAVE